MKEKSNRTILITGAAAGIGRAISEMFSAGNNHLILIDRNIQRLKEWTENTSLSASIEVHETDVSDEEALNTLFKLLNRRIGHLDVLVNSAGICDENGPEDIQTWRQVIDVNLHGTYMVTAKSLSLMTDGGRIVNISSILGRAGKVRNTAYCASKHGIVGMTKALALDLASQKITVNAILPAWVDTPMLQGELATQASTSGKTLPEIQRAAKRRLPQRRFIDTTEVAALVNFLCSDLACGVTAQSLIIDGGAGLGM